MNLLDSVAMGISDPGRFLDEAGETVARPPSVGSAQQGGVGSLLDGSVTSGGGLEDPSLAAQLLLDGDDEAPCAGACAVGGGAEGTAQAENVVLEGGSSLESAFTSDGLSTDSYDYLCGREDDDTGFGGPVFVEAIDWGGSEPDALRDLGCERMSHPDPTDPALASSYEDYSTAVLRFRQDEVCRLAAKPCVDERDASWVIDKLEKKRAKWFDGTGKLDFGSAGDTTRIQCDAEQRLFEDALLLLYLNRDIIEYVVCYNFATDGTMYHTTEQLPSGQEGEDELHRRLFALLDTWVESKLNGQISIRRKPKTLENQSIFAWVPRPKPSDSGGRNAFNTFDDVSPDGRQPVHFNSNHVFGDFVFFRNLYDASRDSRSAENDANRLCAISVLARVLLHELMHVAGFPAFPGRDTNDVPVDEFDNPLPSVLEMAENSFYHLLVQRYPVLLDSATTCCGSRQMLNAVPHTLWAKQGKLSVDICKDDDFALANATIPSCEGWVMVPEVDPGVP